MSYGITRSQWVDDRTTVKCHLLAGIANWPQLAYHTDEITRIVPGPISWCQPTIINCIERYIPSSCIVHYDYICYTKLVHSISRSWDETIESNIVMISYDFIWRYRWCPVVLKTCQYYFLQISKGKSVHFYFVLWFIAQSVRLVEVRKR